MHTNQAALSKIKASLEGINSRNKGIVSSEDFAHSKTMTSLAPVVPIHDNRSTNQELARTISQPIPLTIAEQPDKEESSGFASHNYSSESESQKAANLSLSMHSQYSAKVTEEKLLRRACQQMMS